MKRGRIQRAITVIGASVVALAIPAVAQLEVGENTSLRLNGNVDVGYSADYSNQAPSDHTLSPGGNADLSGFYYNPNFLSFDAQGLYNQSRLNSTEQSLFQTTAFSGAVNLFGGSHFPGTIAYSKSFNSEGGYTLPGAGSLTTRGNNQNVGISWGIHLPDFPQVQVHFNDGNSNYSLLGSGQTSSARTRLFGVQATDRLAGFDLNGGYQHGIANEVVPNFFLLPAGEQPQGPQTSNSSNTAYNVSAGHRLPLHGAFEVFYSRNDLHSAYDGTNYNGIIDTVGAGASLNPVGRLNLSVNTEYTNNLSGSLYQPLVTSGAAVPASQLNYATNSLMVNGQQTYSIGNFVQNLNLVATETYQQQNVLGQSMSATTLSQMVNYSRPLLGGYVNATGSISQSMINYGQDPTSIGTYENVSYTRGLEGWALSAAGNYSRNMETSVVEITSSGYGYSASVSRKFARGIFWNVVANGQKIDYNEVSTSGTYNQGYSTTFSVKNYGMSGSYSKSSGSAILTPTGLVSTPIPVPTAYAIFLRGNTYSFSAFSSPTPRTMLSASYVRAINDTFGNSATSRNSNNQLILQFQHRYRQLWVQGGFFKLNQALSISGQPPLMTGSFYFGVSRWFNFF